MHTHDWIEELEFNDVVNSEENDEESDDKKRKLMEKLSQFGHFTTTKADYYGRKKESNKIEPLDLDNLDYDKESKNFISDNVNPLYIIPAPSKTNI